MIKKNHVFLIQFKNDRLIEILQAIRYHIITKTYLYNFDPLKPHFYIVKLVFTGVYIIFLISAQNIDYWYSLEPPRRGGSNEYPQSMFWAEIWKNQNFLSEHFHFLMGNFLVYLNRHVFVMFMIVLIPYINLFNLSWIMKFYFWGIWSL